MNGKVQGKKKTQPAMFVHSLLCASYVQHCQFLNPTTAFQSQPQLYITSLQYKSVCAKSYSVVIFHDIVIYNDRNIRRLYRTALHDSLRLERWQILRCDFLTMCLHNLIHKSSLIFCYVYHHDFPSYFQWVPAAGFCLFLILFEAFNEGYGIMMI